MVLSIFCKPTLSFSFTLPSLALDAHLRTVLGQSHAADFLIGIFTGKFDNAYLKKLLGDVGLQHVLAISGFHFSLLAALLGLVIKNTLPHKAALQVLMAVLLIYMLIVGTAPSLIRALISIEILLLGHFLIRKSDAINRLGLGLMIVLLLDPDNALKLGFQLSFLATLGILLFYKPYDYLLTKILVRSYTLKEALQLPTSHQMLYILAVFFKRSLALGMAVNTLLTPLLLYYFNQLPLLSLVYNLFFPFLVTGSLIFLLLGLLCDLVGLGFIFHKINLLYTSALLKTVTGLPANLKVTFYASLSLLVCLLLVGLLIIIGISLQKRATQFVL